MRVAHLITDLQTGGTEMMLRRLVMKLQAMDVENTVISLRRTAPRPECLTRLGIALHDLDMRPNTPGLRAFVRLRRLLKAFRPDVVHTWMYHADFVGGLAAGLTRLAPVVWGIHHTPAKPERLKPLTRFIVRANALLSHFVPERIICCAHASRASHEALGFARRKMIVIANGFDTEMFRPNAAARASVRQELDLAADTALVGLIARFHPQKDHRTFVAAAAGLIRRSPDVHFLLAGRNVDGNNEQLRGWLDATGAPERFHVLGDRDDIPRLMAACDVVTTSSAFGEAFPLVLGEAMSCGVPCVTTDVGDSARLVADAGRVVPPGEPDALAGAWLSVLELGRDERLRLGEMARARVLAGYEIAGYVQAHMEVYREVSRWVERRPSQ